MLGFHGAPMVEDQSSLVHNDAAVAGENILVTKKCRF